MESSGENKETDNAFCFQKKIIEVEMECSVQHLLQYAKIEDIVKTCCNVEKLGRHKYVLSGWDASP